MNKIIMEANTTIPTSVIKTNNTKQSPVENLDCHYFYKKKAESKNDESEGKQEDNQGLQELKQPGEISSLDFSLFPLEADSRESESFPNIATTDAEHSLSSTAKDIDGEECSSSDTLRYIADAENCSPDTLNELEIILEKDFSLFPDDLSNSPPQKINDDASLANSNDWMSDKSESSANNSTTCPTDSFEGDSKLLSATIAIPVAPSQHQTGCQPDTEMDRSVTPSQSKTECEPNNETEMDKSIPLTQSQHQGGCQLDDTEIDKSATASQGKTECAPNNDTEMDKSIPVTQSQHQKGSKPDDSEMDKSSCPSQGQTESESNNDTEMEKSAQHRFKPFQEDKWNLRYKDLLLFLKENGHVAVPHSYPKNPQLARWIKRQRRQYKQKQDGIGTTMTEERLGLLNKVKFIWDSHEVAWHEKLEALKAYHKAHGDCNVPSNFKDKKLATWVKCQRRQYKLYWHGKTSAMTPERIVELERLKFEWELRTSFANRSVSEDHKLLQETIREF